MKTHLRFILLLLAILSLASCKESEKDTALRLVKEWDGKEIKFPAHSYEAEESGRFTKVMIVYSNAETSPVRLRIKGDVK